MTTAPTPGRTTDPAGVPGLAKVPELTALFWVLKVLTTGMGESASDWLGHEGVGLAALVGVGSVLLALAWQLRLRHYVAPAYWATAASIAVFGTMAADVVVQAGLSTYGATALYAVAVAGLLVAWRRSEGSLSVHSITTPRRERFYWATVLATFALGTAAGDLVGHTLGVGFLQAGLLFGAAMLVPLALWRAGVSPVAVFWSAYVLTRPLGASFADWAANPWAGGPGWGLLPVTSVLLAAIAGLVAWLTVTRSDVQRPLTPA